MIKNTLIGLIALVIFTFTGDGPYKDGYYSGISRAKYTNEPYYGHSKITIQNGIITEIDFSVRDSVRHEYFNNNYEKYFAGNNEYIQQCRNDWKGIQSYPDSLLKYQDPEQVDVISGATWSYNLFKASVQQALSSARKTEE